MSLCKTYLLRARVTLAMYQFDEVETWLNLCLQTAEEADLKIYQEIASKEIQVYLQQKQQLGDLFKTITPLYPLEYEKQLQKYIKKALLSMEKEK